MTLFFLAACTPSGDTAKPAGPELEHTPPSGAIAGEPVDLVVTADDPDGVASVNVYYKLAEERGYSLLPMTSDDGTTWTLTLDGDSVAAPAIDYYFAAQDAAADPRESWLPRDYSTAPFELAVTTVGQPFPYTEDFETASLAGHGWANASEGFVGYGWDISGSDAHGGVESAYHIRGIDGIDALDDYLVSPAIDLSTTTEAQLTWWEMGDNADAAQHSLWASTGSIDPADGDYVELVDVLDAATEDGWGRSKVIDVSSVCGSQAVYFAWRYQGTDSDDWWIDDVSLGLPTADLSPSISIDPTVVHPGETTTLTVTVANATAVAAENVSVDVSFPSGGASVASTPVSVGEIAGMGTGAADFSLTVDAAQADNTKVPIHVDVTADDTSASYDGELVVGYASIATFVWNGSSPGTLSVVLGVGDPDAPTWSTTMYAADVVAGEQTVTLDVTDENSLLPPAAGANRWYADVESSGGGSVSAFTLSYSGTDYAATSLPAIAGGVEDVVYLPEPPEVAVSSTSTNPSPLQPGTTGVSLNLGVRNSGAATSGPVTATLVSDDPDLIILDPGPVTVSADVLDRNATASAYGVFAFDVAATHVDSTNLDAQLLLTDGVDSWTQDVSLAVPWPVFHITDMTIYDDGGDDTINANESAELVLEVTNAGDLGSDGAVYGTLTGSTTGGATLSFDGDSHRFGTLSAGDSKDEDGFTVTVDGGADGDALTLQLDLYDNSYTYTASTTLTLGQPPFLPIITTDDAIGDSATDGTDMVRAYWRVYDDQLQLRVQFAEDVDVSGLFFEFWGWSTGADYDYYNADFQSGYAHMRGYDSSFGFVALGDPGIAYPAPDTVELDIPLSELGLAFNSFGLGFGAGWCGGDAFYCDAMPEGWGYPYADTFNPYAWWTLTW